LVGEDSILGALIKGQIEPTAMYHALDGYMTEFKPSLTILDVLADMFSGDENSRPQSRQFVGLLKKLARKHDCAFLLLAHPSLTGMSTGSGMSGSTGWNNAVRSRMYFQTAKAIDGTEPNKNLRTLEGKKSNYGVPGGKVDLEWKNGLFVPVHGATGIDKMAADAKADAVFLTLLNQFTREGRNVTAKKGTSYAPSEFASHADAKGFNKVAFKKAMDRLLGAAKIENVESGSPSRRRSRLINASGGDD
jgi:RecA-family ATPase